MLRDELRAVFARAGNGSELGVGIPILASLLPGRISAERLLERAPGARRLRFGLDCRDPTDFDRPCALSVAGMDQGQPRADIPVAR